jgi:ribosomal protein L11 methylase PrmA
MTQTLELTPAELEMIAVIREKDLVAKKEAEAKKALELEKEIQAKKDSIALIKKKDQEQIAAARKYLLDFDTTQYSLDIKTSTQTSQVMGDYIDKENGFDRHIIWSEVYERQWAVISHKGGQMVKVDEQIVYSSSWRSKGESKGYKMYICGPGIDYKQEGQALSRVKSVMEKIKTANDSIEYTKKKEENKRNALQVTVDRFKAEYPDAEVTTDYAYDKGYGSRNYSSGERYDIVRTKFVNGAQISYRVYPDGSLSRVSFNLPGSKDEASFMKNLSQMNF